MTWCHQATSHYAKHCWPRYMTSYVVTRPQWVELYCHLIVIRHAKMNNNYLVSTVQKNSIIFHNGISLCLMRLETTMRISLHVSNFEYAFQLDIVTDNAFWSIFYMFHFIKLTNSKKCATHDEKKWIFWFNQFQARICLRTCQTGYFRVVFFVEHIIIGTVETLYSTIYYN